MPAEGKTLAARLGRLVEFLGLRRSIVGLLAMVVLVGMGEHMAEQFLPLYLIALGGGFLSVGALNGIDNLLGALYSLPGGYLSDRLGNKRALLIFNLIAMAGFVLVVLIPIWQVVLAASALFLSWTAISMPATISLVTNALPQGKRTMGVTMHSLVRRVPMALGPVLGGTLVAIFGLQLGIRLAFGIALAVAAIAAVLQQVLIADDPGGASRGQKAEINPLKLWPFVSPSLRRLLLADILIRFCEQIPYAFVVVWAVGTAEAPGPVNSLQFGTLRVVEMATAILVYIPVAYMADRMGKKPFVLLTFVFFTLFPLALLFCRSYGLLMAAFVLRGLKEFGEPARKTLIAELAPSDRRASVFGLYYLIRDVIVSVAAFGGAFLWEVSPKTNFLTAFAFGVAGTLWFAWRGKDIQPHGKTV